jgi:hypothetical protein
MFNSFYSDYLLQIFMLPIILFKLEMIQIDNKLSYGEKKIVLINLTILN